jgi:hypothetical protein
MGSTDIQALAVEDKDVLIIQLIHKQRQLDSAVDFRKKREFAATIKDEEDPEEQQWKRPKTEEDAQILDLTAD